METHGTVVERDTGYLVKVLGDESAHLDRLCADAIMQVEAGRWHACSEVWGKLTRAFAQQPRLDAGPTLSEHARILNDLRDVGFSMQLHTPRAESIRTVVRDIRGHVADQQQLLSGASSVGVAQ